MLMQSRNSRLTRPSNALADRAFNHIPDERIREIGNPGDNVYRRTAFFFFFKTGYRMGELILQRTKTLDAEGRRGLDFLTLNIVNSGHVWPLEEKRGLQEPDSCVLNSDFTIGNTGEQVYFFDNQPGFLDLSGLKNPRGAENPEEEFAKNFRGLMNTIMRLAEATR